MTDLFDHQTIVIRATPQAVLAFLADVTAMTRWSLGTWTIEPRGDGVFEGRSLFTGAPILFRTETDEASGTIRWWLGTDPAALKPRIAAQVVEGPEPGTATMTLMAWRLAGMDDHRWRRMTATHALEVCLIKDLIEAG